jgi:hypothetical protein
LYLVGTDYADDGSSYDTYPNDIICVGNNIYATGARKSLIVGNDIRCSDAENLVAVGEGLYGCSTYIDGFKGGVVFGRYNDSLYRDANDIDALFQIGDGADNDKRFTPLVLYKNARFSDDANKYERVYGDDANYVLKLKGNLIVDMYGDVGGEIESYSVTATDIYAENVIATNIEGDFSKEFLDKIYPIGSIYMSFVDNEPGAFLGGTWTRLTNRFLVAAGTQYTAGSTGGLSSVTLTYNHLPASTLRAIKNSSGSAKTVSHSEWAGKSVAANTYVATAVDTANSLGGSYTNTAVPTLPPYQAVYMWRRIG